MGAILTPRRGWPLYTGMLMLLAAAGAQAQDIRVRLFSDRSLQVVTLWSRNQELRLYGPSRAERVALFPARHPVRLQAGHTPGLRNTGDRLYLRPDPTDTLVVQQGAQQYLYRGAMEVEVQSDGSLWLINVVDLEDYVASVVGAEMPFSELEALKAQAVLVRTYTLANLYRFLPLGYHMEDHQSSQIYRGLTTERPLTRRAAIETFGQILTHEGRPVEAVYSSTCGGITAAGEEAWSALPVPYLKAAEDPFCAHSPHARWRSALPRRAVLDALSRALGRAVTGLRVLEQGPSGRITSVLAEGREPVRLTGTQLRAILSQALGWQALRSTLVRISTTGDQLIFEGRGLGHGVGLCQYGAQGRARAGHTYREILEAYYPGARLERLFPSHPVALSRP
nr:MAG: sporulation protein [Bacteroidota bacterium]